MTAPRDPDPRRPGNPVRVDASFARLALDSLEGESPGLRAGMLSHPALAALLRHRRIAGDVACTLETLLDDMLGSVRRTRPSPAVLDAWAGRGDELASFAGAASAFLPECAAFEGNIYLAAGYDIGVAVPPDIVLNAGHPHFLEDPAELGYYAVHEAHHAGFMALREPPPLSGLDEPRSLLRVVRYMTQLEGMGVHAARDVRAEHGALGADEDYGVYADPSAATRVVERYSSLLSMMTDRRRLSGEDVGTILGAMSSGERVWYRFGALAAWRLEQTGGRGALVRSIEEPDIFRAVVDGLLEP